MVLTKKQELHKLMANSDSFTCNNENTENTINEKINNIIEEKLHAIETKIFIAEKIIIEFEKHIYNLIYDSTENYNTMIWDIKNKKNNIIKISKDYMPTRDSYLYQTVLIVKTNEIALSSEAPYITVSLSFIENEAVKIFNENIYLFIEKFYIVGDINQNITKRIDIFIGELHILFEIELYKYLNSLHTKKEAILQAKNGFLRSKSMLRFIESI